MKSKVSYIIIIIIALTNVSKAQETSTPIPPSSPTQQSLPSSDFDSFKERIYVGGNVGGWIGTTTYLNLSPLIGFKLNKDFSIGAGFTYNYASQKYGNQKFESTVYGSNAFARYMILENLFAQVGWDRLSVPDYTTGILNSRTWVDNLLVGGGYRQAFSEKGQFIAMIFYNANQTPLSPYPNPIIQIGFNIGF